MEVGSSSGAGWEVWKRRSSSKAGGDVGGKSVTRGGPEKEKMESLDVEQERENLPRSDGFIPLIFSPKIQKQIPSEMK